MLEAILSFLKGLFVFAGSVGRSSMPGALSPEREAELLSRLAEGDPEARDELIERNLRLVAHIAKKYANRSRELDDLIQTGSIGLIKAVGTYTPNRGRSFAAYAGRCIENAIRS
ncbi:MAG: sigma-70 family RNA polymerase sigma factor [Clostridia bacterium]|nr:sigma-70 family RNA polymerase sigma factor [Clostridia bacterium]